MASKRNEEMLKVFKNTLKNYKDFFITENQGMSVFKMSMLRERLKEQGASYKVVKNSIFRLALKDNHIVGLDDYLVQSNGIVFTQDPIKSAKIVKQFIKEKQEKVIIKGGYTEGKSVDATYINQLADLSTKEELIGKLIFILKYPVQKLSIALDAVIKKQQTESKIN